jgi:hypothetical protein
MTPMLAACCVAAFALAACGGSARAPAASPSTAAAPTTTVASTTTGAPQTLPSTTVPPTTAAPTTTTLDPKSKVIADFKDTVAAYNQCLLSPSRCDVASIAAPRSDSFNNLSDFFAKLARNGLLGKASPKDRVVVESVDISAGQDQATVRTCIFDAGVIYDPRGNTDPADDVIVDGGVGSAQTVWTLTSVAGRWRRAAAQVLSDREGVDACGTSAG